jgi:AhpD family alkylhydroperoxidase
MYDAENLKKLPALSELVPEIMKTFGAFDKAAFAPGALDAKTKQIIAVAVGLTTQCPYCIDVHAKEALRMGATTAELAEAAGVAAAIRAGGAITHATHFLPK